MRKVLFLALLVPAFLLAAGNALPKTALAPDAGVAGVPPAQLDNEHRQSPTAPMMILGTLDTVGGTSYDWWTNGSQWQMMASSDAGVHVLWMYSSELSNTAFPDRNMRYNFYDYSASEWNWIDPDYMQSGVNVFAARVGYGNIGSDPATGVAVVGAHGGSPIHVMLARDIAPGAGIFEYADGTPVTDGYQWPPLSVGSGGVIHIFPITAAYLLGYTKVATWPTYEPLVNGFTPDPGFPTHNIVASKNSQKVAVVWENSNDDLGTYYASSDDGGSTWGSTEMLSTPPGAFGPDTTATFHIAGTNLFYDMNDQLHILAGITPTVDGQGYTIPAQIWHWCAANSPEWTKIHDYRADTLTAPVGYNATFATRPSMTENANGDLYVTWEQFDSLNYDPVTTFARADIHAAGSHDNGATWTREVRLTDAGNVSCRFPSVLEKIVNDELWVIYELDQTAGFFVQGEHPGEYNPVVVQRVPVSLIGLAEGPGNVPVRAELGVTPNPVRSRALISYALPQAGNVSLVVYDAAGRPVQNVVSGYRAAGRYSATLDASNLSTGVYFYSLTAGGKTVSNKLTVTH